MNPSWLQNGAPVQGGLHVWDGWGPHFKTPRSSLMKDSQPILWTPPTDFIETPTSLEAIRPDLNESRSDLSKTCVDSDEIRNAQWISTRFNEISPRPKWNSSSVERSRTWICYETLAHYSEILTDVDEIPIVCMKSYMILLKRHQIRLKKQQHLMKSHQISLPTQSIPKKNKKLS